MIKATTSTKDIQAFFDKATAIVNEEIANMLSYLGEQCVARIRDRSAEESWIDHTGNLRSSIGYAVFNKGTKIAESAFERILGGSTGSSNGRSYVDSLASQYANTYALVVVAGMSYADYVEAIENKDVLASTELWARAEIDRYLEKANEKAIKRINAL